MDLQGIRTSLFGYRRQDVYQYISQENERMEALQKERDELRRQLEEEKGWRERAQKAESLAESAQRELDKLKEQTACQQKELEEFRGNRENLFQALLHAEQYTAQLKQQAEKQAEEIIQEAKGQAAEIGLKIQEENKKLSEAKAQVAYARENLSLVLGKMERILSDTEEQLLPEEPDSGVQDQEAEN